MTDPAGLATPDTADGFFRVLPHWDSVYVLGVRIRRVLPGRRGFLGAEFFPGYPAAARGLAEIITPSGGYSCEAGQGCRVAVGGLGVDCDLVPSVRGRPAG